MAEWPQVCTAEKHRWKAVPAAGCFVHANGDRGWYCKPCAIRLGVTFKFEGYKWEPLREPSPAQPSSEREPS